jgi:mRNA interferase RelE/StbE
VRYSVLLSPGAERDLGALDKPLQRRVVARIEALAENPRPAGVTKLEGEANAWRIRVGDYRVLYTIEESRLLVLVVRATLALGSQGLAVSLRTLFGALTEGLPA